MAGEENAALPADGEDEESSDAHPNTTAQGHSQAFDSQPASDDADHTNEDGLGDEHRVSKALGTQGDNPGAVMEEEEAVGVEDGIDAEHTLPDDQQAASDEEIDKEAAEDDEHEAAVGAGHGGQLFRRPTDRWLPAVQLRLLYWESELAPGSLREVNEPLPGALPVNVNGVDVSTERQKQLQGTHR